MGFLPVFQSCPQVDAPARTPACRLVTLDFKGLLGCFLEGGIRQVISRIESDEVTLVTMLEVPVVPVVVPFVQVAHVADGVGMESGEGLFHLTVLFAKHLAGCNGVDEEFPDDGQVGSTAIAGGSVIAFIRLVLILG